MLGINSGNTTYIAPIDAYAGGDVYYGISANVANQAFYTGGSERMRIDSSGNVGIGTTSPVKQLTLASANTSTVVATALNHGASNYWGVGSYTDQSFRIAKSHGLEDANTYFAIDRSNGNVGIGTTSPASNLHISNNSPTIQLTEVDAGTNNYIQCSAGGFRFFADDGNASASTVMGFHVDGSERMRIDSSGNLLVGATSPTGSEKFTVSGNTAGAYLARFYHDGNNSNRYGVVISCGADDASGTNYALAIDDGDGTRQGQITFSGGTTTYGTSSDYRLKENIEPLKNGLSKVLKLNPVEFTWKKNNTKCEGFIAHEVQEICKEAVSGEKDGEEMQGVDYGRITPLLVKAIQEQQAQIEALQSEINLLKGE
jgi:hypothetical protein